MTRDRALCNPGNDVQSALKTVAQRHLRRLPAVDDSGARGMLSLGDMALLTDDALSMDMLNAVQATCDHRNRRRVVQRESFWSAHAYA